jgi:uncharacterized protein involved in exopolysaccharide biosynthesis
MAKKDLSDLLQEEVQRFTPQVGETAIEVTAQEVVEQHSSTTEDSIPTANRRTTPTKAHLEVTIKDLTTTLEKSQKKEVSLREQISDLKADLSTQNALVERLTTELHETKKTALQLAEYNSQLIAEIEVLKKPQEPVKEAVREPVKQISQSLSINPKKSYRSPERLQELPNQANDDFANNTWLYD